MDFKDVITVTRKGGSKVVIPRSCIAGCGTNQDKDYSKNTEVQKTWINLPIEVCEALCIEVRYVYIGAKYMQVEVEEPLNELVLMLQNSPAYQILKGQ